MLSESSLIDTTRETGSCFPVILRYAWARIEFARSIRLTGCDMAPSISCLRLLNRPRNRSSKDILHIQAIDLIDRRKGFGSEHH